jgi:hypothetical protein
MEPPLRSDGRRFSLESGVCWSALHELPYGDPVHHTILGTMHNWLEGVLQHHVCIRWGIGIVPSKTSEDNKLDDLMTNTQHPLDSVLDNLGFESDIIDGELEDLYQESQQYADTPSQLSCMCSETLVLETPMIQILKTSTFSLTQTQMTCYGLYFLYLYL